MFTRSNRYIINTTSFIFFCILVTLSQNRTPFAVPTFNCLGIYWSPVGGGTDKKVIVQYMEQGKSQWLSALDMKYHPISGTTEDKADYRSSIVGLKPGTTYEVKLTLEGTVTQETLLATTWSESFPEGTVTKVESSTKTYAITESGTPHAYRVFDGSNATISVDESHEGAITIEAHYVIIRGFTLKGGRNGIRLFDGCSNIVIEDCDISGWGRSKENPLVPDQGENYNAAVFSNDGPLIRVVIQRTKMHHPATASNSWVQGHPSGPQCIVFWNSSGNHVFRYNECYSDTEHYFNDILGAGSNSGYTGFPGADSDIYGNYLADAWDDGIETEGGNQNVRVWNNYVTNTLMAIANAATTIGPYYVWRNVVGNSYTPPGSKWDMTHGNFMKMGYANSEQYMTGHMYIFHNTIFQKNDKGYNGLGGTSRIIKHCVTRNNIFYVRSKDRRSIAVSSSSENNDFNYDLFNKEIPNGYEKKGINGTPLFVDYAGYNSHENSGNFQLDPASPGFDAGEVIPNFNDNFTGTGPDMGAHEYGKKELKYGVTGFTSIKKWPNHTFQTKLKSYTRVKVYNVAGQCIFSGNLLSSSNFLRHNRKVGFYLIKSYGTNSPVIKKILY